MALKGSKFNDRTSKVVLQALERGHSVRAAAGFAEVDHTTVGDWIRTRPDFALACEKAKAKYLDALAVPVTAAAKKDPRLAVRILEAKDPAGWGVPSRHEVSGPSGGPVPISISLVWPDAPTPPSEQS